MTNDIKSKFLLQVKIPNNLSVFHTEKHIILKSNKNIITVILKSSNKINLKKNIVKILYNPNHEIKKKVAFRKQKTFYILFNKAVISLTKNFKSKLLLVGVGFRVKIITYGKELRILNCKLGYSHNIFIVIPKNLIVICSKINKILILGNCFRKVSMFSLLLKSYKTPEPYKGKGIFYENESISLKTGKKI